MRKKLKKIFSFTKPPKVSEASPNQDSTKNSPANSGNVPCILLRKCSEVKLYIMIACLCRHDYSGLIVQGVPTEAQLYGAWMELYNDFVDLSDEQDVKQVIRLLRSIYTFGNKLEKVKLEVATMGNAMNPFINTDFYNTVLHPEMVADLRKHNFKYKFDRNNPSQYVKDLNLTLTRTIKWEIDIELWESEVKAYEERMNGEPPSEVYFTTNLVRLSVFTKYRVDPQQMYTDEYCILRKDYNEYYESVKNQNNAKRR